MTGVAYRATQFLHALVAQPAAEDLALAEAWLAPSLQSLFQRLSPDEQAHSLAVLQALLSRGYREGDLLAAALLHDVGKCRARLRPWERAAGVIAFRLMPRLAARWARAGARGWQRAFVVAFRHPAWGAEMVRQAGGSESLQNLIRRHRDPPPTPPLTEGDRLVLALQAADGSH